MATRITEEETGQVQRTVEMFEAITESQPDDSQSLEILKDAYNKLGRKTDGLRISQKLANTYVRLGQISQAILEYEGILQEYPNDLSAHTALAELESKASRLTASQPSETAPSAEDSKFRAAPAAPSGPSTISTQYESADADGALAEVLVSEKVATLDNIQSLLQRLPAERVAAVQQGQTLTLPQLLLDQKAAELNSILTALVDRSGLPYLPLSVYDVDRDVACLLPREFCFQHCIVPFDLISRSILIATANPFDTAVREQVRKMVDYNPIWYVGSPGDINQALRRAHGLEIRTKAEP